VFLSGVRKGDTSSASQPVVERIQGELHTVRSLLDQSGSIVYRVVTPLMVELRWRDVVQLIVGACVLGIPVAFTEEVWVLGEELPIVITIGVVLMSIIFLSLFAYFIFYQNHFRGHEFDYLKRVAAAYFITFSVSALLLTLFDKCPWGTEMLIAIKRAVLVTFPACFSATLVDSLK
jgi:uncharacterized membrane protein